MAMSEICGLIWRKSEREANQQIGRVYTCIERDSKRLQDVALGLPDMFWVLLLILAVFEHSGQQWKIPLAGG
jgi:hypothetical protein